MKLLLENWRTYLEEDCWDGYERVEGTAEGASGSCRKRTDESEDLREEDQIDEKKKKAKKDACYNKVKSRYKVWPSAYASGALVKCRKVGAKNWGNKSKKNEQTELFEGEENLESKIRKALIEEGGAAGMKALKDHTKASEKEIKDAIKGMSDVGLHEDGDYILQDDEEIDVKKTLDEKKKKAGTESSKESSLRDWFGRKGAKGSKKGWVDCNTCRKDKKTGKKTCKSCGRSSGEERWLLVHRPEDHPFQGIGDGIDIGCPQSGGKKGKKENRSMTKNELYRIISEEVENVLRLQESNQEYYEVDALDENEEYCPVCAETMDEAKKKPCKPSKGKRFAKRVDGKCRSYGQAGQAKGGGDRIRPGTKKGDAYCARSAGIKKCKNPPCANTLSRKKWKCRGKKSMKE